MIVFSFMLLVYDIVLDMRASYQIHIKFVVLWRRSWFANMVETKVRLVGCNLDAQLVHSIGHRSHFRIFDLCV